MINLPKKIYFVKGTGNYKYTAILPNGTHINFGNKNYQHYKDKVPKNLGGGLWTNLNHLDKERRRNYRLRHSSILTKDGKRAIDVLYSPAWFSYHFLW